MDPLEETWQPSSGGGSPLDPPGEVTILKGRHTWRFCFSPGHEPDVFAAAAAITERPASGLDHFDLAILAYRLGLQAGYHAHPSPELL
jgi:hypothetical protein